jgi:glutamate--cysteine ligase
VRSGAHAPSRRDLLDDLRSTCFAPSGGPAGGAPRIGVELEALVLDASSHRPFPLEAGLTPRATAPALRRLAASHGWQVSASSKSGDPEFRLPDGARITFEPGGQLEYSSAPHRSASEVLKKVREVFSHISAALEPEGAELMFVGIDPFNSVEDTTLQLRGERYARMDRHFWRLGSDGARMMRQSASAHISLDWGELPGRNDRWRLLNALVPYLTAIFANSGSYERKATGWKSFRRAVWMATDSERTGLRYGGGDAAESYLAFALNAPAILLPAGENPCVPFARWLSTGCLTMADWHAHLSTLFPEVRPRGYLEVRSIDSLSPSQLAAPVAFLLGLTYDAEGTQAAMELLGEPDSALLESAGRDGLSTDEISGVAQQLWTIALEGCARLGEAIIAPWDLERAADFAQQYTAECRSPSDDAELPAAMTA